MAKMAMQGVLLLSIVAALLSGAATAASIRDGRLPPSALDKFTQSKGHWNRGMGPREVKNGWIDTRKTGNSGDWPAVDDHENDQGHHAIAPHGTLFDSRTYERCRHHDKQPCEEVSHPIILTDEKVFDSYCQNHIY